MATLQVFFLLFFPIIITARSCSVPFCGNNGLLIRFPFRLQDRQPWSCGYPGFDMSCNSKDLTVLTLPHSGDFSVREINYATQQIQLYDPESCLARRLLRDGGLNLSGSPFVPFFSRNFTFISCPSQVTQSRLSVIDCLSNSTHSILATTSENFVNSMSASCKAITTLLIPIPISLPVHSEEISTDLGNDLRLSWYQPDCRVCESKGGMCGYTNETTLTIGCLSNSKTGRLNSGIEIFRTICFIIALPALICAIGIGCFACFVDWGRRRSRVGGDGQQNLDADTVVVEQHNMAVGLDEVTIESYEKVVLGESRRLPGHNDISCPICLSEYCMKDTVKCIPECKHCFHAECIDEWLRMNGTCPLCRTSPSPSHVRSDIV